MLFKMSRLSLAFLCLFNGNAFAGKTTRVNPVPNEKDYRYSSSDINANGRYITFVSDDPNLVAGDTNNHQDVFVHDRWTHKVERVSDLSIGKKIFKSGHYYDTNTSADGRHVAFVYYADDNSGSVIFVHDRLMHKTTLVSSVISLGIYDSTPRLSADGRYIAFESNAPSLISNDTENYSNIFVYDQLTHKTERISNSSGINGSEYTPSLSADGRYVAFRGNGLWVYDRKNHKMEKISDWGTTPYLSANGRYVAFSVRIPAGEKDNRNGLFVHDRLTHKTERIRTETSDWYDPNLSADGRYVSWTHAGGIDLDIYAYDRLNHTTGAVSHNSDGLQINEVNLSSKLSADGRHVVFDSYTSSLFADDTGGAKDIFVRDRLLDTTHQADLTITPTTKPATLKPDTQGTYLYTITNNGKDVVPDVSLIHLVSGGSAVSVKPSQGKCSFSSVETVCHLGQLAAGKKLTLSVTVKAQTKALSQQVTVSGAPVDAKPGNNQVSVATPVK